MAFGPIIILLLGALLIAVLSARVSSFALGLGAAACCVLSLGWLVAAQQLGASASIPWLVSGGRTLEIRVTSADNVLLSGLLLVCGTATAGTLAGGFGRSARAYGMVYCGLLVLLAGGLLAIAGLPLAALLGLGVAWLGGTMMQQAGSEHTTSVRGSLPVVALASALLALGVAPLLSGEPIAALPWLAGCCVLIAPGAWWRPQAAPLLVRAPSIALGLPALGGALLLQGMAAAEAPSQQLSLTLLLFGVAATLVGAWNALSATRLGDAFAWQTTAQLGTLAIVYGTGRPEAGPMAAGLLAHALVVGTAAALVLGLLERSAGSDALAALKPLPRPMVMAGLAYGIAAASAVGLPPLLGFSLRQVVFVLAQLSRPWLPPVLLAGTTLLALSYLPALAACFRRPMLAPAPARAQHGAGWPLMLMAGLVAGGLIPQTLWQRALGDPAAAQAGLPRLATLAAGSVPALLLIALLLLLVVWLRRARPGAYLAGGTPLDQEPGWALPFGALRRSVRPPALERLAALPMRVSGADLQTALRTMERRRYLLVAVAGLLIVLLLALR